MLLSPLCLRDTSPSWKCKGESLFVFTVWGFAGLEINLHNFDTLSLQQTHSNQVPKRQKILGSAFKRPHSPQPGFYPFSPEKEEAFHTKYSSVSAGMDPDTAKALQDAHTNINKILTKPFPLAAPRDQKVFCWCFSPKTHNAWYNYLNKATCSGPILVIFLLKRLCCYIYSTFPTILMGMGPTTLSGFTPLLASFTPVNSKNHFTCFSWNHNWTRSNHNRCGPSCSRKLSLAATRIS